MSDSAPDKPRSFMQHVRTYLIFFALACLHFFASRYIVVVSSGYDVHDMKFFYYGLAELTLLAPAILFFLLTSPLWGLLDIPDPVLSFLFVPISSIIYGLMGVLFTSASKNLKWIGVALVGLFVILGCVMAFLRGMST